MSIKDEIYELEVFSKFTEDGFFLHFKVNDTLEDRVKEYILKDAKNTRDGFNLPISDKELERLVSGVKFKENGFFHLQVVGIMLHYSGEYKYLL